MEQPGRLFNRAPVNIDPLHHQNRRQRLHQVASYHDLDDLPTMVALPEMKARGGVVYTPSPQTVTDVKVFEPSLYQEDAGGVAIDLCLPETDDGEDYFLLEQEEDDLLLLEQEYREPQQFSRPSRTFLAPILEERRVAFAAQHVVMKVDQWDSCSMEQRYVHQVVDAVQVWFIPNHTQYSEKQRAAMWYSKPEMAAMRERATEYKKSKKQARMSLEKIAQQQVKEIDQCTLFGSPADLQAPKMTMDERSGSERRVRYESTLDAVLMEQYEQRRLCLKIYGRVESGFTGILDPERLAQVYSIAAQTSKAQEKAVMKAERALLELDQDEEETSSVTASVRGGNKQNKVSKLKRTSSFKASALEVETTLCLDKGVGSVFSSLLTPFLEIRKEDLFLEVGEEMSVQF
uniref:Uncharacterized protein n=1 Tax=Pseudo-nitzschia delicatissima TaxID=44447 RepID=A0A7S0Y7H5_9STRA